MPTSKGILARHRPVVYIVGMRSAATTGDALRHRLLERALLRLACLPDAGGLALRGGVLLRHWLRPDRRVALDLDLVASPLTVADARRYLPLFAVTEIDDGVTCRRLAPCRRHLAAHRPPRRAHLRPRRLRRRRGRGQDRHHRRPTAARPRCSASLPDGARPARLSGCRPEAVAGQKLQPLWHLGMHLWRPKDLDDLRLLLGRVPMGPALGGEAVTARPCSPTSAAPGADARSLFAASSWWGMKYTSARWLDYVAARGRSSPRSLQAVVAEVAERLAPLLEGLP
ncbi:MAG: hypothetical protein U0797_24090 [Gemmataceae bacterium]